MGLIWSLVIGACAGFLGSKIFKGASSGLLWNLIIGILGGFLGGFVFGLVGLGGGTAVRSFLAKQYANGGRACDAIRLHVAQYREQHADLFRGENGGGLVEYEDTRTAVEYL